MDEQLRTLAEIRLGRVSRWVENLLSRISLIWLGALLGLLGFLKAGFGVFNSPLWPLDKWPQPVAAYPPLTYGFRLPAWLLHTESRSAYNAIALVALVVGIPILAVIIGRNLAPKIARFTVLIFLGGPAVWILWGGFGRTDILVLVGGALIGFLGRKSWWAVGGTAIASLGNPEQATVIASAVLLLSFARPYHTWRIGGIASTIMSYVVLLSLTLWSRSLGVPSRWDYFPLLLRQSLNWFFNSLPIEIYAGFGLTIVVVIWAALEQRWVSSLITVVACVGLPLLITATTLDQSRVLVCTSIGGLGMSATVYAPRIYDFLAARFHNPNFIALLLVLVIPPVEITADVLRPPWASFFPYLVAYLLGG